MRTGAGATTPVCSSSSTDAHQMKGGGHIQRLQVLHSMLCSGGGVGVGVGVGMAGPTLAAPLVDKVQHDCDARAYMGGWCSDGLG